MRKVLLMLSIQAIFCMFAVAGPKAPVTILLMGDETMADNTELDETPQRGWGQVLPSYLTGNIVVQNYAKPGYSAKRIQDNGSWTQMIYNMKRGDIVILQLGNNDRIKSNQEAYSSIEDFEVKLMELIKNVEDAHAKLILCTPVAQNVFNEGAHCSRMGGYSEAVRRVAKRKKITLIDVEQLTEKWIGLVGEQGAKDFYTQDKIMLTEEGALEVSRLIAEEIQRKKISWFKYVAIPETIEVRYTNLVQE